VPQPAAFAARLLHRLQRRVVLEPHPAQGSLGDAAPRLGLACRRLHRHVQHQAPGRCGLGVGKRQQCPLPGGRQQVQHRHGGHQRMAAAGLETNALRQRRHAGGHVAQHGQAGQQHREHLAVGFERRDLESTGRQLERRAAGAGADVEHRVPAGQQRGDEGCCVVGPSAAAVEQVVPRCDALAVADLGRRHGPPSIQAPNPK
jgi:hypothetical protein